jgi:hypothetical protein
LSGEYRAFLANIHQRMTSLASELRARLSVGVYLALVPRDGFHGLASNPDSGVASGVPLAQWGKKLLGGALHVHV